MLSAARKILLHLGSLRAPPASRRLRAALTAFVFMATSLLGVLHEATTSHVRCAAHGELVDSDAPVGAAAVAPAAHDTLDSAQPSSRAHGDEHCLLASALRASRIAPRAPAIAAVVAAVGRVVTAAPPAIPAPAGLYRIAPKTSPPA